MNAAAIVVLGCFDAYMWLIHIPMLVVQVFA